MLLPEATERRVYSVARGPASFVVSSVRFGNALLFL